MNRLVAGECNFFQASSVSIRSPRPYITLALRPSRPPSPPLGDRQSPFLEVRESQIKINKFVCIANARGPRKGL